MRSTPSSIAVATLALIIQTAGAADTVRPDGVGALRIGMTINQVEHVLKERIQVPTDPDERNCFYAKTKAYQKLGLMIQSGHLRRIEVYEAGIVTNDGIQIGDPVEKVVLRYGRRLQIDPHFYTGPENKYLTVVFHSGKLATRFETDKNVVSAIYSGQVEQVQYVEGCQ